MAPFFPAFDVLYIALGTRTSDVGELVTGNKLWLSKGLAAFEGQNKVDAEKLKQKQAVPLDGLPQGLKYQGKPGKGGMHADACLEISQGLGLSESQTVLLVSRWVRDSSQKLSPGWIPDSQQLQVRFKHDMTRTHPGAN